MDKEKQAAKEAEEVQQQIVANLKEATKNYYHVAKIQKAKQEDTRNTLDGAIKNAPSLHKQKIANTVYEVRKLLKELENGGNQADIIKKIKEINIK